MSFDKIPDHIPTITTTQTVESLQFTLACLEAKKINVTKLLHHLIDNMKVDELVKCREEFDQLLNSSFCCDKTILAIRQVIEHYQG